jgi:hypothetical protein
VRAEPGTSIPGIGAEAQQSLRFVALQLRRGDTPEDLALKVIAAALRKAPSCAGHGP